MAFYRKRRYYNGRYKKNYRRGYGKRKFSYAAGSRGQYADNWAKSYARYYDLKNYRKNQIDMMKDIEQNPDIDVRGSDSSKVYWGKSYKEAGPLQRQRRQRWGYKGKGDYKSWAKYVPRALGAVARGAMGYMEGGIPGAMEGAHKGWENGGNFSKFIGWGDYAHQDSTSENQIMPAQDIPSQQQISVNSTDASGDIYISHTEFVQNVYASVASAPSTSSFQITNFPINPGLQSTFPFLSQLAQNYVLYELQGLIYQYKPTSGEYGNNNSNAIGKVVMATNYDPDALPFISSVQMENYDYANSSKPSCGILHGVECKTQSLVNNMLYVRTGATSKDKVFTDVGTFSIATEGIPFGGSGAQTALIGELWVTYRLRLSRANLYGSILGRNIGSDYFTALGTGTSSILALPVIAKSTNNIGTAITLDPANKGFVVTFPPNIVQGAYRVTAWIYQPGNSIGQWMGSYGYVNCFGMQPWVFVPSDGHGPSSFVVNEEESVASIECYIQVNAPGNLQAQMAIQTTSTVPGGGDRIYIMVEEINNYNLNTLT